MRLRDHGIAVGGLATGPHNAITDVPGVRVGHVTIVAGDGPLRVGEGPVRTGVTAIHPHEGSVFRQMVPAAIGVLNGAGEITGRSQVDEYGVLETPIVLTNTLSVGTAHRAVTDWLVDREGMSDDFVVPVVAETYDGFLNDIAGQHVRPEHVRAALDLAVGGPVAEGSVGGGTGMALFGFKGGIGTSSREVEVAGRAWTVGVLVQGNFGKRHLLRVGGVPVGRSLPERMPIRNTPAPLSGSILVIIATDAPLSDRQLARLTRRGMLGIARTGSIAAHGSGDLLLAFSNAPSVRVPRPGPAFGPRGVDPLLVTPRLHDAYVDLVFEAAVDATEEAILNALFAGETMIGRDGNTLFGAPRERIAELVRGTRP